MINVLLKDDQYEEKEITHTRLISRAVVVNDENKVAILHIVRDDIFGAYDYYELPGGGLNGDETPEVGAVREIHEETGVISEIIAKLGVVTDYYNMINRQNINHYFLMKVQRIAHQHLDEYEYGMIKDVIWVDINEAINLFASMPHDGVSLLVKRRELPILIEASKFINK